MTEEFEVPVVHRRRRRRRVVSQQLFYFSQHLFFSLGAIIFTVLIFRSFSPAIVPTPSMSPTLKTGSAVVIRHCDFAEVEYGDIVTLYPNLNGTEITAHSGWEVVRNRFQYGADSEMYIKRLIGKPGDTIEIRNGVAYRNGTALDEPYIKEPMEKDFEPYTVPEGRFFVMGDNRNDSWDSRYIGAVDEQFFVGVVVFQHDTLFVQP